MRRLRVGGEPAEAGSLVGAGAGLAEDGQLCEAGPQAAGGAVFHRAGHAVLQIGDVTGDVEGALDARLEGRDLFGRGGVLQVVEGSAVGESSHVGAQLQRGHGDALAEAAHAAYAAFRCGKRLVGIDAQLLALNVVAGQFAEAELVGVVANALKAELAAQFFKVEIVALGQRLGHVHAEARQAGPWCRA